MPIHLIAHDIGLLTNFVCQHRRLAGSLIEYDAQGRFEGMSQISDLRSRSFKNVAIRFNQEIDLTGDRCNVIRKLAIDMVAQSAAN